MFVDVLTEGSAAGDGSVHPSPVENNFSGEVSIVEAVINGAIGLCQLRDSQFPEQIVPGAKEIPIRIPGITAFVNLKISVFGEHLLVNQLVKTDDVVIRSRGFHKTTPWPQG